MFYLVVGKMMKRTLMAQCCFCGDDFALDRLLHPQQLFLCIYRRRYVSLCYTNLAQPLRHLNHEIVQQLKQIGINCREL